MDETKVRIMEYRIIRIKLVDGTIIHGQVNINQEEGYDRLSDLLGSQAEEFVILNGATIYQAELENPVRHSVLFVNKRHILWSSPEEGQK